MKSRNNLYSAITSFDNLLLAAGMAARCKRKSPELLDFFLHLEDEVWRLHEELLEQRWQPGAYRTFVITAPKQRLISAAPFRDRVVHHALIGVIGPVLERSMLHDSYANRVGKGTHRAIARYQQYLRRYRYVLKCDIRKFFSSIDHLLLKSILYRRIACPQTRWLIDRIIDCSNLQDSPLVYFPGDTLFTPFERSKGLPIGNLTSQVFANYYLNGFDHSVKEVLRCKGYVRYVDDCAFFADSKRELWRTKEQIAELLVPLRLKLNERATAVYPSTEGRKFLGQIIFPSHRLLPTPNVLAFKRKLRKMGDGRSEKERAAIAGWTGHARQADTRKLREALGVDIIWTVR